MKNLKLFQLLSKILVSITLIAYSSTSYANTEEIPRIYNFSTPLSNSPTSMDQAYHLVLCHASSRLDKVRTDHYRSSYWVVFPREMKLEYDMDVGLETSNMMFDEGLKDAYKHAKKQNQEVVRSYYTKWCSSPRNTY